MKQFALYRGPFVNYVSILGYLVGQKKAIFCLFLVLKRGTYVVSQKLSKMCLRNLRMAPIDILKKYEFEVKEGQQF